MKRKILISIFLFVFVLGSVYLTAQIYSRENNRKVNVVSYVYQNFEEDPNTVFDVTWSPFGIKEEIKMKAYDYIPVGLGENRVDSKKSMGLHAAFSRKGFNWIEITPKKFKPFKGKVKSVSSWVWGGNFAYDLEYVFEDYLGFYWPVPAGMINFYGWKNLVVILPGSIPQEEPYIPRRRGLALKKVRLVSNPNERTDRFHIFFDYMKVVTDTYKEIYDGLDLEEHLQKELYGDLYGDSGQN